jgi:hypothetical protein
LIRLPGCRDEQVLEHHQGEQLQVLLRQRSQRLPQRWVDAQRGAVHGDAARVWGWFLTRQPGEETSDSGGERGPSCARGWTS